MTDALLTEAARVIRREAEQYDFSPWRTGAMLELAAQLEARAAQSAGEP